MQLAVEHLDIVELLLDRGARIDLADKVCSVKSGCQSIDEHCRMVEVPYTQLLVTAVLM